MCNTSQKTFHNWVCIRAINTQQFRQKTHKETSPSPFKKILGEQLSSKDFAFDRKQMKKQVELAPDIGKKLCCFFSSMKCCFNVCVLKQKEILQYLGEFKRLKVVISPRVKKKKKKTSEKRFLSL